MFFNPVLGKQVKKSEGILDQGSGMTTAILCGHGPQWRDMPDCPGDACEVARKVWVPEMGALKGRQRLSGSKEPPKVSEREAERWLLFQGHSGSRWWWDWGWLWGPLGIVRGQGGEGGEDLNLDLDGDSEKEGGEQKFQMASFPIKQTRHGGP